MNEKKKILIADDELSVLKQLEVILKDEYDLVVATSGLMVLNVVAKEHVDLILLDYNLSDIDGRTVAVVLNNSEKWNKIPIIIVSGYQMPAEELSPNVKGFLGKPVAKEELIYSVKNTL